MAEDKFHVGPDVLVWAVRRHLRHLRRSRSHPVRRQFDRAGEDTRPYVMKADCPIRSGIFAGAMSIFSPRFSTSSGLRQPSFGAIIAPMKFHSHVLTCLLAAVVLIGTCLGQAAQAQAAASSNDAEALVKQGQKLSDEGKQDEALKLYKQALEKSPNSYQAHLESGVALDLKGDYPAAREHLKKAIEVAPPDQKNRALRTMAFSYAFEGNASEAEKYEKQAFDALMAKQDFEAAAGVANELARIKLEAGDVDGAATWYKTGYETAMRKTDMKETDKNLWAFRWANAQARIAARRGQRDEAQKQVAAAKAALDKANNPDQAPYFPYLTGYVAFYGGDYKTAIADLERANQEDPFILLLLAQSYEKSGNTARAKEYYQKILANNGHGPTNAFARPVAKKKLAGG
jgi:tetratricopeptide (TPR) repeat protein